MLRRDSIVRFLAELKTRGVLKVATAYLVLCWLVLEVGHTLFQIFDLPHGGLQVLFVLMALGFPVLMFAAWYWRFAASGTTEAHTAHDAPQMAIVFGAVAIFAVAVAIGVRFFGFGHEKAEPHVAPVGNAAGVPQAFSPPPHSVAVLSFVNMSGDDKDEYFSDGLSEELLHALARVPELKVAARTSSFSFKGTKADIPTVGHKLNVGAVLEGSVRRAGQRVRITAQLINAVTGYHLWSEIYDRDFADIIAMQTEIATAVASALEVKLFGDVRKTLTPGGTLNSNAFDAYLRGRAGEAIQDEQGLRSALADLNEAITLDPKFANAYAMLGDVQAQIALAYTANASKRRRMSADALASARTAVALAPTSGFVHRKLGRVMRATTTDYTGIEAAYRRSMELEPGSSENLRAYAEFAILLGRPDALVAAEQSLKLDPLSSSAYSHLGMAQYYLRRYDPARAAYREAMRLSNNRVTPNWAGMNEVAAGRPAAALPFCERDLNYLYDQWCLAMAYHKLDRRKEAADMLKRLEQSQGDDGAYFYAEIYSQWGQPRESMNWLAKAAQLQDPSLIELKMDPLLDEVRSLPEFQVLLTSLNLPK